MSPVTARLSSKGQIILPSSVRQRLDLHQGDTVMFEEKDSLICICKLPKPDPSWNQNLSALLSEWEDDIDDDV
jgi:AbrB family looped-hinge helix DNA binding protein